MSIWEGKNCDLVSVIIDGSHKKLGWHKKVSSLLPPPKPHCWFNLNHDETEDPIETEKSSQISAAQIEKALPSPIAAVPIVVTKGKVFLNAKVPTILSSIYASRKISPVAAVTVVAMKP